MTKMVWRRFKVFADNWETNYDLGMSWVAYAKASGRPNTGELPPKFEPMTGPEAVRIHESQQEEEPGILQGQLQGWRLDADSRGLESTGAYEEHFMLALSLLRESTPCDQG